MKLIKFPEQTVVFAENQPEYLPLPAFQFANDPSGRIAFCWQLTWRERLRLLFTGRLWHTVLTFREALQPQMMYVTQPFTADDVLATRAEQRAVAKRKAFIEEMLVKYGEKAREKMKHMDARNFHPNDRRRSITIDAADFSRCREMGVMFIEGCRIVDADKKSAIPEN